jgi:hypothetical protein
MSGGYARLRGTEWCRNERSELTKSDGALGFQWRRDDSDLRSLAAI